MTNDRYYIDVYVHSRNSSYVQQMTVTEATTCSRRVGHCNTCVPTTFV